MIRLQSLEDFPYLLLDYCRLIPYVPLIAAYFVTMKSYTELI